MIMKDVTSKNKFVSMSMGAQALYLHLNAESDDDGIAEAKFIMRMIGAKKRHLIELEENDYITILDGEGNIVYINDWHAFNSLGKYLVYPSVHRQLLLRTFPGLKDVLFKPKNNILSLPKGARRKGKRSNNMTSDASQSDAKPNYGDAYLDEDLPFGPND